MKTKTSNTLIVLGLFAWMMFSMALCTALGLYLFTQCNCE